MKDETEKRLDIDDKAPAYPALTIDYALYEKYLKECDWTDAQKREFIETLWSIMVQFVDLGFGIHAVQQAGHDSGGDVDAFDESDPDRLPIVVSSTPVPTDQFMDAADCLEPSPPGKESA